ncbi:MAG: OmpA family protein [Thermoguttaceae bacterium]
MGRTASAQRLLVLALPVMIGCAGNPLVLKGQLDKFQQEQLALSRQKQELQSRANSLDRDNRELVARLTQEQQRARVLEDQVAMLREQLSGTAAQLARLREEKNTSDQKVQALTASLQRQGGTTITPNNSLLQALPAINLPDVHTRRDGDVIRIELPAHRLFEPGNARLQSGAYQLIAAAASEILRTYPDQIIGVEGHTDSDPLRNPAWRNHHHLSLGQALAVYEVLVTQVRVPAQQLFVAGHGANHPLFSNATTPGKQRNARVELVIYPETVRRQ